MTKEAKSAARYMVLHPSQSLVEEAARQLIPDGRDFSRNLVVFPGKRPAHFLRKIIAQAVGSGYIPPAILSMEELMDRVYEKIDGNATAKIETIDAIAFLFDLHRSMEKPLGGREFLSLEAFFPLGLRIYRDIEELLIEGVEPARLRPVEPLFQAPLPPQADGGLQSLSFFYEGFYAAIGKAGFSSRSQRYAAVSSSISRGLMPYERIVFAGFYALTESERRLFKELMSWEHVCFLFTEGPGLAEKLATVGIAWQPSTPDGDGREDGIHFYKSADVHGQAFALASVLKGAAEGGRPPGDDLSTVIVLPSAETLFPVLHHALPFAGESYNVSLGYPLDRTPAWGFLVSLMQVVSSMDEGRVYIPDYLGFALHPYTKNIYMEGRTDVTRIMFHALEETLLADRTKSFASLEEIEGLTGVFNTASERLAAAGEPVGADLLACHLSTIHDASVRQACAFDNIADFAERMARILTFIYDRSSARLHPYFHPFVESLLNELDGLRKSRIRDLAFSERNSYFHFFRRYIAHSITPFEGTPLQGVQVLGFLETRALTFERVCVLDVNEDVLPDTRKEETLLPFQGKTGARAAHIYRQGHAERLLFRHAREGRGRGAPLFRRERQEGKEQVRRTAALGKAEKGRVGDGQARQDVRRQDEPGKRAAPARREDRRDGRLSSGPALRRDLPRRIPQMPLRFYYRYVLDLERKEGASSDIERMDIGRLVHDILFRYFENKTGRLLTAGDIDTGEMRAVASRVFEKSYGPSPIGPAYLLKRQVLSRMEAFLIRYQAAMVNEMPVVVHGLERRMTAELCRFSAQGDHRQDRDQGRTALYNRLQDIRIGEAPRRRFRPPRPGQQGGICRCGREPATAFLPPAVRGAGRTA